MSILTLDLFVDEDQSNYYWVDVKLPAEGAYQIVNHGTVPQANSNEEIHIDVHAETYNNGSTTIQVLIGESDIDTIEGEVSVHLKVSGNTTDTEKVLVKNAQQSSRPIGVGDLS